MHLHSLKAAIVLAIVTVCFGPSDLAAQTLNCDVECYPSPGGAGYSGVVRARGQRQNVRARAPMVAVAQGAAGTASLPGSSSYSYAVPILHLPGRNGLDLALTLYYNSAIWNADVADGSINFNADRDFPSYGFRLDFGISNTTLQMTYTS
jgi:hypothetical protein